jgi:K+-sensing histidine kinase KdpD
VRGFVALALLLGFVATGLGAIRLALHLRRERAHGDALRAALQARLWEERVLEIDELQATVQELRRRTHESNNALSTALLSAQYLLDTSRAEPLSDEMRAELVSAASGMVEALQKLRVQLDRGPKPGSTSGPRSALIEPAELWPVLERCATRARFRHRGVSIDLVDPEDAVRAARISVCAGSAGLERALGCVLQSAVACARSRVERRAGAQLDVDVLAIEISDDGPAFASDVLGRPIAAFEGSRPNDPELCLYTAERILRASLGSLKRENASPDGARVSLFFPLAREAALQAPQ